VNNEAVLLLLVETYFEASALGILRPTAAGRSTVPKSSKVTGNESANPEASVNLIDDAVAVPVPKFHTLNCSMKNEQSKLAPKSSVTTSPAVKLTLPAEARGLTIRIFFVFQDELLAALIGAGCELGVYLWIVGVISAFKFLIMDKAFDVLFILLFFRGWLLLFIASN